jgi:TetR/AcrR family transcriptional repressor of nem operon
MRKSRTETAETRKHIVATASRLFLARGLAATGIADIMAAAGLTQGGFYRHFESKEQLIAEASAAAFDRLFGMLDSTVTGKPPEEALNTIVTLYLNQCQEANPIYLCPLANIGIELRHSDKEVKAIAVDGYERLVRLIAAQTRQLGIKDHTRLAEAIVSAIVGGVTLSQLALDRATATAILTNARHAVDALLRAALQGGASSTRRRSGK